MSGAARDKPVRSPADWARATERRTLSQADGLLREARANTRRVLGDPAFLAQLAAELAASRGAELTRVYRNLVWVLPGFRKCAVRPRGNRALDAPGAAAAGRPRTRVTDEVCVVFVVRRKGSVADGAVQHLPRWLITYAEHGGNTNHGEGSSRDGDRRRQRLPFALRTDVQDMADYHGVRAHTASAVWVQNGNASPNGSFVGLVRLVQQGQAATTCLLSAMHVLTPFPPQHSPMNPGGLPVKPLGLDGKQASTPLLATSLALCGELRSDARYSFDAQLAECNDLAAARACVPLRRWHAAQPHARHLADVLALKASGSFYLLTPDNHSVQPGRGALRMRLTTMPFAQVQQAIPYLFAAGASSRTIDVFHVELLSFECVSQVDPAKVPIGGDSGSPIVALRDDNSMTLVAMHIAGNGKGLSWGIPAWALFKPSNWAQCPIGAAIEPLDA